MSVLRIIFWAAGLLVAYWGIPRVFPCAVRLGRIAVGCVALVLPYQLDLAFTGRSGWSPDQGALTTALGFTAFFGLLGGAFCAAIALVLNGQRAHQYKRRGTL